MQRVLGNLLFVNVRSELVAKANELPKESQRRGVEWG